MNIKRTLSIILPALALLLTSCTGNITKVKEMQLTSFKISSVSPAGLKAVDLTMELGIDNPAVQFTLSDIQLDLYRLDQPLGSFTNSQDLLVKGSTVGTYTLSGRVSLSDGVSLAQLLSYVSQPDPADYSLSYSALVTLKSGVHTTLSKKNVPLSEFLSNEDSEQ